jgi:hypothetical protein
MEIFNYGCLVTAAFGQTRHNNDTSRTGRLIDRSDVNLMELSDFPLKCIGRSCRMFRAKYVEHIQVFRPVSHALDTGSACGTMTGTVRMIRTVRRGENSDTTAASLCEQCCWPVCQVRMLIWDQAVQALRRAPLTWYLAEGVGGGGGCALYATQLC